MESNFAAPGIRGIEHVGLAVPDIEAATRFFVEVLGAQVLYDLLDRPIGGAPLAQMVEVPEETVIACIRMIRLGEGPNIELFQYSGVVQQPPGRQCDFGLSHFALYVDDIDSALARLLDAGCRSPGGAMDLPGRDSGSGNRFAYVRLPWGGWIELITAPSPQRYEAETTMRRWRPVAR